MRARLIRLLVVLPAVATACSAVLGIEDAKLDPSLGKDAGSGGGSGGTNGGEDSGAIDGSAAGAGGSSNGSGGAGGNGNGDAAGGAPNGGAGGSGGSSGPDAAADAARDAGPSLCEQYCTEIQANCTGNLEIYPSMAVCLDTCATLPAGEPGDMTGNSVQCRLENAKLAKTTGEPEFHCPAAGPGGTASGEGDAGGTDVCGTNCEGFCTIMLQICPDEYVSLTACRQDCDSLTDLGGFNDSIQSGDSVQCRLYHVGAATQATVPHCSHAAGAAPCK